MAVVIRLTKVGKRGERRFRIVVKEKRSKRDGRAIETLGWYEKRVDGISKQINMARLNFWQEKGAKPSERIKQLLKS